MVYKKIVWPLILCLAVLLAPSTFAQRSLFDGGGWAWEGDSAWAPQQQSDSKTLTITVNPAPSGSNIYLASAAAGSGDGSSCANAKAYTFFNTVGNWGTGTGLIGPGTTVHLCGTITVGAGTNALDFKGSGSSGSPVTLKFETGASIQSPYFPYATETSGSVAGAITVNTKNYITIDGGTNGVVKTTANGTLLANKQNSTAISVKSCTGCIVKNLEIGPIYVHVKGHGDTSGFNTDGIVMYQNPSVTVDNVYAHTASFPTYPYMSTSGTWNQEIKNSTIADYNEGVRCPNSAPSGVGLKIHDNQFQATDAWDVNTQFHNNGIHCYSLGAGINMSHPLVFNNTFTGTMGQTVTAMIYMEGTSSGNIADMWVFNNVLYCTSPSDLWFIGLLEVNGTNPVVVNNTVIGCTKQGGSLNAGIGIGNDSTNVILDNNTVHTFNNAVARTQTSTTWSDVSNNNYFDYNDFGVTYNVGNFSIGTWQGFTGGDATPPTTLTNPNVATAPPWKPAAGSPLINAGKNLSAKCSQVINGITVPELCSDINHVARGSSWTVGAAQP